MEPIFASVRETQALMSLGKTKIYQLIDSGKLLSCREGGKRLIYISSIRDYEASKRPAPRNQRPPELMMGYLTH